VLQNLVINLSATGMAAVLIVLILCMTALALYGKGGSSDWLLGSFAFLAVALVRALVQNPHKPEEPKS
jgi:hypothetical protein